MKPGAIIAQTKRPDDYDQITAVWRTLYAFARKQGNLAQPIKRKPKE